MFKVPRAIHFSASDSLFTKFNEESVLNWVISKRAYHIYNRVCHKHKCLKLRVS